MQGLSSQPRTALRIAAILFFALIVLLLVTASPEKKLDHDEHQFIAAAYLLVQQGSLPYLDYPYFHVPYLIVPYALLAWLTDHLLLSARLFSVLCSLITLALISRYAASSVSDSGAESRLGFILGSVILLVSNPLFIYTSGLSWNHDASVTLSVAGTLATLVTVRGSQRMRLTFFPGLLFGLAIGTRLSALPLLVPVVAYLALFKSGGERRREVLARVVWLSLGVTVALLPMLALLAADPEAFLFGNFGYASLNTAYRELTGYRRAMSVPGKLLYFLERVVADPGSLVLFLLLGFALVKVGVAELRRGVGREVTFLVALIAFAFLGGLAPTPSFPQYFFAVIPFTLLAVVRATGLLMSRPSDRAVACRLFLIAVIVCGIRAVPGYWNVYKPLSSEPTPAAFSHRLGGAIRERVEAGRVLTLAPIFALEGGLDIYEPLATGPFAWRTAALISPADRARLGLVSPLELNALLRVRPAAAVLVGVEREELEGPLIDYARNNDYRPDTLNGRITLWVAPLLLEAPVEREGAQEEAADPR